MSMKYFESDLKLFLIMLLKIKPVNVKFINVADVSSMDAIKVDENAFRITIVGVGIEIVDIIVD